MSRRMPVACAVAAVCLLGSASGALADGGAVTPAGWRVDPAGSEFGVGKEDAGFQGPLGATLTPDGTRLLTTSSGAARIDSVDLWDLAAGTRTATVPYDATKPPGEAAFYGVVVSPDGKRAWASGGGQDVVHSYDLAAGKLTPRADIPAPFFPAGLAYGHTPAGDRIYVANNLSVNVKAAGAKDNPPGHQLTVIDPATDKVTGSIELGDPLEPIGVTFTRKADKAYVTNWLGRSVSVVDTATEKKTADIVLSPPANPAQADHPSAIVANPAVDEVYTANSNSDTVSVIDTTKDTLSGTIDVSLVKGGPKGAIPDGLAVSPDGRTLYVAEAGENAVAVVDLATRSVRGFIPTAWYPAAVSVTPDGKRLVVTNTNDSGAGPNPCGPLSPRTDCPKPDPNKDSPGQLDSQYAGSMIKGSVQVVDVPTQQQLDRLTDVVRRDNQAPARSRQGAAAARAIKHVIYIIKENRTYDQVFGSLPKGNGDPSLNLFGDDAAPNHRALASKFTLLDNFYADAEVSADGHNWSTAAQATDYVDKTWPINYSPGPRSGQRAYDFEDVARVLASEPLQGDLTALRSAAAPTNGYLWDNAYAHGVSFRDYGEFTTFPADAAACAAPNTVSHTTHLQPQYGDHVDARFPSFSMSCSDHTQREPEWEREFRGYERSGDLPALTFLRFPSDHTAGTTPGAATPAAYVADNDAALGRLVDVVSHSRFWKSTVIMVVEDDAQNGPDHVDAHRTVALAISPYTQTGTVDSTHYSTSSMVATTEDLLGLPPMSITDARAARMWQSFASKPDLAPYTAKQPTVVPFPDPGYAKNSATAAMAKQSATWDLAKEDQAPEIALNQAIWQSVKGRHSHMPAPRHEHIVGTQGNDEDQG